MTQESLEDQLVVGSDGIVLVCFNSHVNFSGDPGLDTIEHVRRFVLHEHQDLVSDTGEALDVLIGSALNPVNKPLLCIFICNALIS